MVIYIDIGTYVGQPHFAQEKKPKVATWPEDIKVVLDDVSYNPGSSVRFRLIAGEVGSNAAHTPGSVDLSVTVFPTGGTEPIAARRIVARNVALGSSEYQIAWRVPDDVPTGRYSAVFEAHDPESAVLIWKSPGASFAVWRSEISIEDFDTHRRFYSPGDPVSFTLTSSTEPRKPGQISGLKWERCSTRGSLLLEDLNPAEISRTPSRCLSLLENLAC